MMGPPEAVPRSLPSEFVNQRRSRTIQRAPSGRVEVGQIMKAGPPPRLRLADRQQVIPAMPLDDLLDTEHQARVVWDFCHGLDLSDFYDRIRSRDGGPGRAAFDPRICVALCL